MQVAFIYGKKPSSTLTWIFTGSTCYHVGFTDGVHFWDMNKTRRRTAWPRYAADMVILADCPVPVTAAELDEEVRDGQSVRYGYVDYLLFGLRWAYHLVGKSTRNYGGEICSEWVANVLRSKGWLVRFKEVESPACLEDVILGARDELRNRQRRAALLLEG